MSVHVCHGCEFRQRPAAPDGRCACLVDDVDIAEHADAGYCPKRYFGSGVKPSAGPGDVLHVVLQRLGYPACGGCRRMRRQMNAWGWWGCWRHRDELLAWFKAKGKERGVKLTVSGLFRELGRAWRRRG